MSNIIYGLHSVEHALRSHPRSVQDLWVDAVRQDPRMRRILDVAQSAGIKPNPVPRRELDEKVQGGRHQGVVARVVSMPLLDEQTLLMQLAAGSSPVLLLILDGVTDPHNLGACLRTAEAAGVTAVLAPRDRACGLTPVVRKIACGAAERLSFVTVTNLARLLRDLKEVGVWIVGLAGDVQQSLYQLDLRRPKMLALVLGAEGEGLRRLTREHCDALAYLPMLGAVESLNVSVAAGVSLYEAVRQRAPG